MCNYNAIQENVSPAIVDPEMQAVMAAMQTHADTDELFSITDVSRALGLELLLQLDDDDAASPPTASYFLVLNDAFDEEDFANDMFEYMPFTVQDLQHWELSTNQNAVRDYDVLSMLVSGVSPALGEELVEAMQKLLDDLAQRDCRLINDCFSRFVLSNCLFHRDETPCIELDYDDMLTEEYLIDREPSSNPHLLDEFRALVQCSVERYNNQAEAQLSSL
jgi:hypothetical protein